MDLYRYLYPTEYSAQLIVAIQFGSFFLWLIALGYFMIRDLRLKNEIEMFDPNVDDDVGNKVAKVSSRPLFEHLDALRDSGRTNTPLDISGLIRNTSNRLTSNRGWLRSVLSLFIVLGLLGTLWGLASSLSHLSILSPGQNQITNENLAQGLNVLLSKLGGAFAPSIWGVFFTIVGVVIFSIYLRTASIPLINSLESKTLISWAPVLAAKRVDESKLMEENIKAAQGIGVAAATISYNVGQLVTTFNENLPGLVSNLTESVSAISDKLSNDATELADDVKKARTTLKALTVASENLNQFSQTFKDSVEKLYPFSDAEQLRLLYEQLLSRSDLLLENNEEFQRKVHDQLSENTQQKALLIATVGVLQDRAAEAASSISHEIGGTAEAAKEAFTRLSTQNENVIKELVNQVGNPVSTALIPIPGALEGIETEIKRINTPLADVSDSIANTSFAVIEHARNNLTEMADKLQAQVTNLEVLSGSIDNLAPKIEELSNKVDGFNTKTKAIEDSVNRFGEQRVKLDGTLAEFGKKSDEVVRVISGQKKVPDTAPSETDGKVTPIGNGSGSIFGRLKQRVLGRK